jgi:hypothetical protein
MRESEIQPPPERGFAAGRQTNARNGGSEEADAGSDHARSNPPPERRGPWGNQGFPHAPAGGGRGSFRPQPIGFDTVGTNPADTIE